MKYRVRLFVYILLVNLASANAQDDQQRMTALRSALETYVSSPITFRNHSALNHYSDLLKDHETTIRQWVFELYKTHLGTGHARTEYNRGRSSSGGIVQKDLNFVHYEMPYWFKDFGQKPDKGWPLVIVLHGGGSDKSSNDDQYEAMKTRYQPGIAARNLRYAALRAPNDEYDGFYTGYFYALYHRAECLTHVGDSQAVRSLTQCGEPMRFAMAAPIDLRNDFDSVSLRRLAKRTRDATQSRRLLALAEVYDGGSRTDASRIGGVGLQIIRDWVLRFNARGPDGLIDGKSPGAPSKLNADHRRALAEVVEAGPVPAVDGVVRWRRKDLARWLLETFAISLDETTVGRELKALGFAKISARPRHYAQNELAVEAFKKNFPAELAKIRARLPKGVEIELWWQDEARIGQKNKLTRRWARRGTRPRAPRDQRTEWAYIFGAICPAKGKGAGLVMPWCDTDAMAAHLIEISAAVDPGAHAVLIVDQAGWHLTPKLAIPDNITVLALPPRSPELNPVENVWQFMRDNWLSNRIFKSYEDIVALCCQAWNNLIDQPWKIMSLGMRKWAHGF